LAHKKTNLLLSSEDQDKILVLIDFLKIFKEETDNLQREIDPPAHLVLLSSCRLLKHCGALENDPNEIKKLKSKAEQNLRQKIVPNMTHKIATFLWPPFKNLKMLSIVERKQVKINF